jgi:hypothetical protein
MASDLELLRRFEPVIRFTKGEQFFPSDVERYVQQCGLCAHFPDGREAELVPEGALDMAGLIEPRPAPFGTVLYLKLIGPLNLADSARALRAQARQRRSRAEGFRIGQGRLARVGYTSRMIDALFSVSLLLRGSVPGATAAAAELLYDRLEEEQQRTVYYGRVVRDAGWIALQYWCFYFYNSWRSGFHGVNDHESDWEQILVYLYEDGAGAVVPQWVAYASHDFHGDDLRRLWTDRGELELVDGHPVVYAGAGSHASYFRRGEYQTDVGLPLPKIVLRLSAVLMHVWTETLGQAGHLSQRGGPFRIPFVDFARGDGLTVGPGQEREWEPVVLDPVPEWVSRYRGLWGLFARDPISGENAPAGPMYNRDGSVRASWYDPVGFAGLDKLPPPPIERQLLDERQVQLGERQAEIARQLVEHTTELQQLGVELAATIDQPHLSRFHVALTEKIEAKTEALAGLKREQAENTVLVESLQRRAARLDAGEADPPHAHIRHLARPATAAELRYSRLAEVWAALSIGLLILLALVLIAILPSKAWVGIGALVIVFVLLESIFRGTFTTTVTWISVVLAVVALLLVFVHYWWQATLILILGAALFLLVENLRELRG